MKKIGIRVDGNEIIATGHIGRTLSIARAIYSLSKDIANSEAKEVSVVFIVSDERSSALIKQMLHPDEHFEIIALNTAYDKLEEEINILIDCISQHDISSLLIDSYFVTPVYFKRLHEALLSEGKSLIYLDDLKAFSHYDVDVIINYDASVTSSDYSSVKTKLLGNTYTPLREQFSNSDYTPKEELKNIFISAGGTDSYNVIGQLIKSLPYELHILTSRLNKNYDELISQANSDKRLHIYSGLSDVASLMKSCDYAVCAGGTTLCELCAIGLPTISYSLADNQLDFVNTFDHLLLIPYAGDVRTDMNETIKNIADSINCYSAMNIDDKYKLSNALRAHIDGLGASRIAKALLSL